MSKAIRIKISPDGSETRTASNSTDPLLGLGVVRNSSKTKKVSSDGVFFRCANCGFKPQMKSSTDDLLIMHFCPKCGSEFE